ncbi:tetratricopeptide repeat protein [Nonomuraea sp. NPDC048882]|uniref:tetratricopeptide repeat protein n=1 Tax=Nonomuraea sp. NPDC048882 TaxID=3154347 RepID=UPI0033DA054D
MEAQRLLLATGLFLNDQGAVGRSLTYLKRALGTARRLHGDDHPLVLNTRAALAYAHRAIDDLKEAIPCWSRTWPKRNASWALTTPTP